MSCISPTGTTRYLLDGLSVLAQYGTDGARQAWYTQSLARIDEVLKVVNGAGKFWYQADALGSVYALTTQAGEVRARGGYDVFGESVPLSGTAVGQPFGFTGREHEGDSGLVYARARYLQPEVGRWTAADPSGMPDGPNRYSYALGAPTRWTDVTGRRIDLRSDPQMWQLLLSATSTPIGFSWYFYATLIPEPIVLFHMDPTNWSPEIPGGHTYGRTWARNGRGELAGRYADTCGPVTIYVGVNVAEASEEGHLTYGAEATLVHELRHAFDFVFWGASLTDVAFEDEQRGYQAGLRALEEAGGDSFAFIEARRERNPFTRWGVPFTYETVFPGYSAPGAWPP